MLIELEDGDVGFVDGGSEKSSERDENQQQTQPAYGSGLESNPGHIGVRRVLAPLHHSCSPEQAGV